MAELCAALCVIRATKTEWHRKMNDSEASTESTN